MKICDKCKHVNASKARFCNNCGAPLGNAATPPPMPTASTPPPLNSQPTNGKDNSTLRVIVGIICLIVAIGCIIARWNGAPKYPSYIILVAAAFGLSWAVKG